MLEVIYILSVESLIVRPIKMCGLDMYLHDVIRHQRDPERKMHVYCNIFL